MEITQKQLKKLLNYNKATGVFTWLNTRRGAQINSIAGTLDFGGYVRIQINKKVYKAHRLAWVYIYGVSPKKEIDHINGNKKDNRICNLRDVSTSENSKNSKLYCTNTSGVVGITYNKISMKWIAQITVNYKNIRLGTFKNKKDAIESRTQANQKYNFHINHGRKKNQSENNYADEIYKEFLND